MLNEVKYVFEVMVYFNNGICIFMKMGNMICIKIFDGSFLKGFFNRKKGILML